MRILYTRGSCTGDDSQFSGGHCKINNTRSPCKIIPKAEFKDDEDN